MRRFKIITLLTIFAVSLTVFLPFLKPAKAASITDVTVALSDDNVSATGTITITFTPNTAITNGSIIEVTYDDNFTGGASITDADISVTGTNITSSVESDFAAGYFQSVLTTSGSVTTTVTMDIDATPGITNPAANGNYNWSVTVNIGGTGVTYDYGAGLAYIDDENDVNVTATVPPTIDMELFQTGSDTELADPNTCALGVLSLSTVKTCSYDVGVGTNAAAGFTLQITSDGPLNSGGNDINACSGTNCNGVGAAAVNAGNEEYGFYISDLGTGCSVTASGSYGTAHQAVPTTATTIATSTATCNGTTSGQSAKHLEITHAASMDTSTVVGTYDQSVTYTAYTN